jgi:hypothetical protein
MKSDVGVVQPRVEVYQSFECTAVDGVDRATDEDEVPQFRARGDGTKHKVLHIFGIGEVETCVNAQQEDMGQSLGFVAEGIPKMLRIGNPANDGYMRATRSPEEYQSLQKYVRSNLP